MDKGLLVVLMLLPGVFFFAAVRIGLGGWPTLPAHADPVIDRVLACVAATGVVLWLALLVVGLILRRPRPESPVYVYAVTVAYALTIATFVYLTGSFRAPGWLLYLGGAVLGLVFFGRRVTLVGIATFFASWAALVLVGHHGGFGVLDAATYALPSADAGWSWRTGISSVVFASLNLAICAWIISLWRAREAQLERLSTTDALTGLLNRRRLMERFELELERAAHRNRPLACVIADLDHFKKINDERGHLAGDRVLEMVSAAILASVRRGDVVARYGGEEFVIILPNADRAGASEVVERCRQRIESVRLGSITVTASMGISIHPQDGATIDELLSRADKALYRAKEAGRNRIEWVADHAA